jgi:hypothetical protein
MFYKIGYHGDEGVDLSDITHETHLESLEGKIVRVEVTNRENDKEYKKFLDALYEQKPFKIEIDDQSMVEVKSDVPIKDVKNTLNVIYDYISASDMSDGDKEPVKNIMGELYREAHGSL